MSSYRNKETSLKENISVFDEAHRVKQIILIGEDGCIRNIELEFVDDSEELK